jgi:hypothetical protein
MGEGRVVRLDVEAHLDGKSTIGITLTETPRGDYVFAVRPKGSRLVYTGMLSEAALGVAYRHARGLAEQKRTERKTRRRR